MRLLRIESKSKLSVSESSSTSADAIVRGTHAAAWGKMTRWLYTTTNHRRPSTNVISTHRPTPTALAVAHLSIHTCPHQQVLSL